DSGPLDRHRNPDSPLDVVALVLDRGRDAIEQRRVVTAVVDDPAGQPGRVRHIGGADQVAAPDLDAVEADPGSDPVHGALDREVADLAAAPADEAAGGRVRVDEIDVRPVGRDLVGGYQV